MLPIQAILIADKEARTAAERLIVARQTVSAAAETV